MAEPKMAMIGMAVMGRNFAQNFASKGFDIALFNRTTARTVEAYQACKDLPYASQLHPVTGDMKELVKTVGADGNVLVASRPGERGPGRAFEHLDECWGPRQRLKRA